MKKSQKKMTELPKYMLLTHPLNEGEFIIRTKPPIIVGQVVKGDIDDLIREYQPMAYGRPYDHSFAIFYAGLLASYEWSGTPQEQADYLAKIMRKMSDFYLHIQNGKTP
jgi:hypothetical protein